MRQKFLWVLLAGCLAGCSTQAQKTDIPPVYRAPSSVELDSIKAPQFGEDFATLNGKKLRTIYWGVYEGDAPEKASIMWDESGYPGFGYPMVISIPYKKENEEVTLVTSWGTYKYALAKEYEAYENDGNLVLWSGKKLINWGRMSEDLYLYNKKDGKCLKYSFVEGTEIVLEK